nr:MAG TPA: hypothetical protein [Caudoviricetes sp.]DAG85823.1 MAG TPA: hypothetical protein [Caudoviricetes sp.]
MVVISSIVSILRACWYTVGVSWIRDVVAVSY